MRKGACIHYTGILNTRCRADVTYTELAGGDEPGWGLRLPCLSWNKSTLTCDRRQEPTEEQVKSFLEEFERHTGYVTQALRLIESQKGDSGKVACPRCGNTIHWSRSPRNKHLHLRCSTPKCVSMMQ